MNLFQRKRKPEMVKIDKETYEFMREKVVERGELKKELTYVRWLLEVEKTKNKMNHDDWKLYYDYIDNNWYYLEKNDKEDELEIIRLMDRRSIAQEEAFRSFLKARKDLEEVKNGK